MVLIVVFWIAAAILVGSIHTWIEPWSARVGAVAVILALLAVGFAYTRLVARRAGGTHALGVGIVWLALSIVVEIAVSFQLGHAWFTLLGSPEHPMLRQIVLFAWIFSPVLFASRQTA